MQNIKFSFKNFKAFRDSGVFEIRPITILIGKNSSGKSTILKFLLMMKQTFENRDPVTTLLLNGKYVNLGSYNDLIWSKKTYRKFNFDFIINFSPNDRITFNRISTNHIISRKYGGTGKHNAEIKPLVEKINESIKSISSLRISYTISLTKGLLDLSLFNFYANDKKVLEIKRGPNNSYSIKARFPSDSSFTKLQSSRISRNKLSINLIPSIQYSDENTNLFNIFDKSNEKIDVKSIILSEICNDLLDSISWYLQSYFENLYYIGPLREYPQRFYISSGETRQDVGIKGEFASDLLFVNKLSPSIKSRRFRSLIKSNLLDERTKINLQQKVSEWLKEFGMINDIDFESIKSNFFQLLVKDRSSNYKINIADTGFGVSQILPIIVEGFYSPYDSLILIEQPEIHLHPEAQSNLGDLFIDIVKNKKSVLVETHSEHLILRLRRRIAEKKLNPSDVAIYYANPSNTGTELTRIDIGEYGEIVNWPNDFFAEDYFESLEIAKTVAKRKKEENL